MPNYFRRAIALGCFTWCVGILAWTITSVTHQSWMGVSFAVAGTLGMISLFNSARNV